jgi:uncharacterized phage protein gp47/JayE
MTDYGLTTTGFRRKTYAEIVTDLKAWQRGKIATKLDLSARTVLGNVNAIVSDQLAQAWEALEAAIGALDPDNAVEALLVGLCKLTGVVREGATYGHAYVMLSFDRATTIPAETLYLAVNGEAANLWTNDDDLTIAGAGDLTDCAFTSAVAGATATAAAGTLITIVTPITGLTAATNPTDADAGEDVQTIDELRTARENSLAATGKGTAAAIAAAVSAVDGVLDVRVFENDTDILIDSIPPHTIRCVVWDGTVPAADDTELAQAIYDSKGVGRPTYGSTSDTATDPWGASKTINFDRAAEVEIYVLVTVVGDTTEADVQAAILAAHAESIDNDVLYAALLSAAFAVEGVTNVTALTLGTTPAPGGTADIAIGDDEVGVLDTSRIGVTIT